MKITPVDIQHREFKKALQGYAREDVDRFLDQIIESMEEDIDQRTQMESTIADLSEKVSHFKTMEASLQSTLLLAQRTADEVKATAHKEVDIIKQQAKLAAETDLQGVRKQIDDANRELLQVQDQLRAVRQDLRNFLARHLALIDGVPPALSDAGPDQTAR
ncbi:MAG: DivIVA domain-containing protein [Candidatus Eremiobacteraeota bacterium]|nr:DivIVA domain-containing protein [Candidatus Eremiobacteraeota bacterium]MBC5826775.1 DivIVA domain-containing protein [Candidatus Eremiobacteraeota bacterium]